MDSAGDTKYFAALARRLAAASPELQAKAMVHVDYLAGKANVTSQNLLNGRPFTTQRQYQLDAMHNIDAVLGNGKISSAVDKPVTSIRRLLSNARRRPMAKSKALDPTDPEYIGKIIALAEGTLEGWCSREKANAIAEMVTAERPELCIEIGVYGGRSLVPAAAALKRNGTGAIYGIETWRPDVATEHVTNEVNDAWWKKIDFHALKTAFYRFIVEQDLASQVRMIEAPSADAAPMFGTIDYLHIDGAHSIYNAAEDVVLYAKKVKPGGIIIMDDANWVTTEPAVAILDSLGERLRWFNDEHGKIACIIYRKH